MFGWSRASVFNDALCLSDYCLVPVVGGVMSICSCLFVEGFGEMLVESVRKIQEISHDIADAFRNNFVAVIVFLLTVLLTDSIDFTRLIEKEISPRITAVCIVFTVSTILYFMVTLFMGAQKWKWLNQSYDDLKKNYDGVFDRKDLDEAFNHDKPFRNAEKQYNIIRNKLVCAWIVLIIMLVAFTCSLMCHEKHFSTLKQVEVEVCESSDNSTS